MPSKARRPKPPKGRNPIARAVLEPAYRRVVIGNKKRKPPKNPRIQMDHAGSFTFRAHSSRRALLSSRSGAVRSKDERNADERRIA